MQAIDQARIVFAPRAHRGGKHYISALIKSVESALKETGMIPIYDMETDCYITAQIGLVDQGLDERWLRRIHLAGSLKIEPKAKVFWQRLGRYIQSNMYWPSEITMRNWPEWQILSKEKIPLPVQSSATARKRKHAAKIKREQKQAEQEQTRARVQEQETEVDAGDIGLYVSISTLTADMREIRNRCKKLEVIAQPVDNAVTLASTASQEVRGMRDHLLSLENRLLAVEKQSGELEPRMDDLWQMIDLATAPKNDKAPEEGEPDKPKSWLQHLKS